MIENLSADLKDHVQKPNWADFVKTGVHNERPPSQKNWWDLRAASILFKISRFGPVGVSKLRKHYGGRKNRGMKPDRFKQGSGNIIRKILQQLESADLIKQTKIGTRKGRSLTAQGKALLNKYK